MKILLVEDSATLRYTMSSFIQRAGHEAMVADSGEQALQLVEKSPVDLIIMDVEMPGLDGFETTRLIREFLGERWLPIVFLTGMADEASYQRGIDAGGDDYMIKPVSYTILQAKIRAFQRIVDMQKQLHQLNRELQALSQRDSLTGLFNRRAFEEKASLQWQISMRAREPVALLMIDVDHFKDFNDHYGHQIGDDCLQTVAEALDSALSRPADLLARYGGEEFIALLPNTDLQGAETVAELLRKAVFELDIEHGHSSAAERVTVSVGGAVTEHTTGHSAEEVIREADNALYQAKSAGRNRVKLKLLSSYRTLLLVDANGAALQRASRALGNDFNIITAQSREECLEIAHNCNPDLIVLGRSLERDEFETVRANLDRSEFTRPIALLQLDLQRDSKALSREIQKACP